MSLNAFWWICLCLAACSGVATPPLAPPSGNGPTVLASPAEVLVVFPADSGADFPWPPAHLTDRFAGPWWSVIALGVGPHPPAAAAKLEAGDSLRLAGFESLDAVGQRAGLYRCVLETHIITCAWPLRGTIEVNAHRFLLRITEPRWVADFTRRRPDSVSLRIERSNRKHYWAGKTTVTYLSSDGGA